MSGAFRRFEILLPLRFNNGRAVPDELVGQTLLELRRQFGAVSVETQPTRGIWQHQGLEYRDDLTRVYVECRTPRRTCNSSATSSNCSRCGSSSSKSG
jgi:hypothetical protein